MERVIKGLVLFTAMCSFAGCATVLSGTKQTITLHTDPAGARCEAVREGRVVATVETTPGAITIEKTKNDINIWCKKEGFAESKGLAPSGNDGYTLGNIVLSGLVGWGVDSALGADNKYPDKVTVNLLPREEEQTTLAKLETLKKARDAGLLSKKEYAAKKQALLKAL